MRPAKIDEKAAAFWEFFVRNADRMRRRVGRGEDAVAVDRDIWDEVRKVDPGLGWEMGPEAGGAMFFSFAPQGDLDRLALTRDVVRQAPPTDGWVFHASRPPKLWTRRVVRRSVAGREIDVDYDQWRLRVARVRLVAFLAPTSLSWLSREWLEYLGYELLESELGEGLVIEHKIGVVVSVGDSRDSYWMNVSALRGLAESAVLGRRG